MNFMPVLGNLFSRGDEALQNDLSDSLGSGEVISLAERVMSA